MYINSIIIAPRKPKNNLLVVVVVGSVGVVGSVVVVLLVVVGSVSGFVSVVGISDVGITVLKGSEGVIWKIYTYYIP